MRIIVCYKCVPDDQQISIRSDRMLDLSSAQLAIGRYDLEAVEAAMKLPGENEVYVLTVAGDAADNSKLRKAILSRGPLKQYAVRDRAMEASDSFRTAAVLRSAIEQIGDVDLVLCGEGSEDMYSQQVGPLLGTLLKWPTLNAVSGIEVKEGNIIVERSLESCTEVIELKLPAVISVCAGIEVPRIPSMRDILAAGKKPYEIWDADELCDTDSCIETLSILAPEAVERRREIISGADEDGIERFYHRLCAVL